MTRLLVPLDGTPSDAPARDAEVCTLWATLHTRPAGAQHHVAAAGEPRVFLRFPATGLLVGLPDEPQEALADSGLRTIELQQTDGLGLGLRPEDIEQGVALCGGHDPGTLEGWHCEPVVLLGTDAEGERRPLLKPAALRAWLQV